MKIKKLDFGASDEWKDDDSYLVFHRPHLSKLFRFEIPEDADEELTNYILDHFNKNVGQVWIRHRIIFVHDNQMIKLAGDLCDTTPYRCLFITTASLK